MAKMYCKHCGQVAEPEALRRGSTGIEVVLWIGGLFFGFFSFFISVAVPLIYTIWRSSGSFERCPKCQVSDPIPLDSPVAQKAAADGLIPAQVLSQSVSDSIDFSPGDPSKYL